MGMYNEVRDKCPECGQHSGYLQISQVVLGFGEFDLSDLARLKRRYDEGDLSKRELEKLTEYLEDENFDCCDSRLGQGDTKGCGAKWRVEPAKIAAIRMLSTVSIGDTQTKALQLLRDAGIIDS